MIVVYISCNLWVHEDELITDILSLLFPSLISNHQQIYGMQFVQQLDQHALWRMLQQEMQLELDLQQLAPLVCILVTGVTYILNYVFLVGLHETLNTFPVSILSAVAIDSDGSPVSVSWTGDARKNIIVWMDHRAVDQAARINSCHSPVLQYCGGSVSPEMQAPKVIFKWLERSFSGTSQYTVYVLQVIFLYLLHELFGFVTVFQIFNIY